MHAGSAQQVISQSSSTPVTRESSNPTDYAEVGFGRGRPDRDDTELTLHDGGALTRRSVLPGGVRAIAESVPGLHSASINMWFGVGSRDKVPDQKSSTHFLEHLLFKGTAMCDAHGITEAFDMIGGGFSAATSKEHTSYYARVLIPDGMQVLDVLADMVTSFLLEPDDVETERGIIISKLADAANDPINIAQKAFARVTFGEGTPLGRPIGGTNETVTAAPRDAVWEHCKRIYAFDTLMVAIAGVVDHDKVCGRVLVDLAVVGWGTSPNAAPRKHYFGVEPFTPLDVHDITVPRESEQSHLYLACRGITVRDEQHWIISVLITVLGGGMPSRLFQEVREKRGLTYATYAFDTSYAGAGASRLYAGRVPSDVDEACAVMIGEFEKLAEHGVTEREMIRARNQLCGAMVPGGEDSLARMGRLGRAEVVTGCLRPVENNLRRLETVTPEEVRGMAVWLVERKRARILVGPVG